MIDSAVQALKVPPHSVEAEQSVLGGLLLDNSAWDRVGDVLTEKDFYRPDHGLIYRVIGQLVGEAMPADVITVSEAMKTQGGGESIGIDYLNALAQSTPSASNIRGYAEIVRDRSVLRRLIQTSDTIASTAFTPEGRSVQTILDEAESRILAIGEEGNRGKTDFFEIAPLLTDVVNRIDELYHRQGSTDVTGVATSFIDLDRQTSGLQKGDLIIVAGRPSMGKTTFAMNIAENGAIHSKQPVAVFSMEMPADALAMRMLSSLGRIDQHRLRTGKLNDDDWPRLTSAIALLNEAPLFIDDTPALSPTELRARARRLKREHGLSLIVIDYLQLMQGNAGKANENRATEISEISRSLKALGKELEVPVIALSQLNRSLEQRPNKRPVMSDLRESGAIEQDADLIVFIYRDEVYNSDSPDKGKAEIIIGKQRNGPIGTVALTFQGKYTRFENFAPSYYEDQDNYPSYGEE